MRRESCEHLSALNALKLPKDNVCESCISSGGSWVHLRTCQTCGVTLCCDSSPNKHATQHALEMKHPVAISAEQGERWAWCYVHEKITSY